MLIFHMSIQSRLLINRYSTMNLRTPTPEELDEEGLHIYRSRPLSKKRQSEFRHIMEFPAKRDKYYSGYSTLIRDFFDEVDKTVAKRGSTRAVIHLYKNHLVRKLAYYIKNPQYYGNSFDHYGITWVFNLMMAMRSFIMRQRIERGELPPIWNKHNFAQTKGHYESVKPMNNPAMRAVAYELYEFVIDDTMKYLKRSGVTTQV